MTISIETSAFIVQRLRRAIALLTAVALSACGSLSMRVDQPFSPALKPSPEGPLVRIAQDSSPGPELTGFRLMPLGVYSLDARIQLARRARYSLDLQYYLIQNDRTGRLLMRSLRDAALRGVRVCLLVDDLYTVGGDPMFRGLAAFPNVEVRLFNPFCCARQSIASKYAASFGECGRLNHRMHNKLFIADGTMVVAGGRNIADEYFMRSASDNFVDMDAFAVGAVVAELTGIFDAYWNSPQVYPVEAILGTISDREEVRKNFDSLVDDGEQMMSLVLPPIDILGYGPTSSSYEILAEPLRPVFGASDDVGCAVDVADCIVKQRKRHRRFTGRELVLGVDDVLPQLLLERLRLLELDNQPCDFAIAFVLHCPPSAQIARSDPRQARSARRL
jgi:cardiolipin synthase C